MILAAPVKDVRGLRVRRAEPSDAEPLAAVYRSAYRENRRLGFPAKAESVTSTTVAGWIEEHLLLVAAIEEEVVAGVRLEQTTPERAKLSRLGVHADWKGNGIGSRLLEFAESTARDQGYKTIWLTTPDEHPYLPQFYRVRGYETTGDYPLEYRDYDEILMEKNL